MKNNKILKILFYIFLSCIFVALIYYTFDSYQKNNATMFQGLSQILGGLIGGIIALIGVIFTLKEQHELSEQRWQDQLDLTKEEWHRQDLKNAEDWRIKVMPLFEIDTHFDNKINYFDLENNIETTDDELYFSYNAFRIKNVGKDIAIITGVLVKRLKNDTIVYTPKFKSLRVLPNFSVSLEISGIIPLKLEDCHELFLKYEDILGNIYNSKLITKRLPPEPHSDGSLFSYIIESIDYPELVGNKNTSDIDSIKTSK